MIGQSKIHGNNTLSELTMWGKGHSTNSTNSLDLLERVCKWWSSRFREPLIRLRGLINRLSQSAQRSGPGL